MSSTILISSRMTRALRLDVVVGEARRDDDVGEEIERELDLLVEDVRVERRVLLAGEGVDVAAEDVDHLRDLGGVRASPCP